MTLSGDETLNDATGVPGNEIGLSVFINYDGMFTGFEII